MKGRHNEDDTYTGGRRLTTGREADDSRLLLTDFALCQLS